MARRIAKGSAIPDRLGHQRGYTRRTFLAILLILCSAGSTVATSNRSRQTEELAKLSPLLSPVLDAEERYELTVAFSRAMMKVQDQPSCRALFDELGLDARSALTRCFYEPAADPGRLELCDRKDAAAVTVVNGSRIFLCEAFWHLTPNNQVAVLIHEALHGAGLTESPRDPGAPTACQITRRVKEACAIPRR